jgi:hypothetical protein
LAVLVFTVGSLTCELVLKRIIIWNLGIL